MTIKIGYPFLFFLYHQETHFQQSDTDVTERYFGESLSHCFVVGFTEEATGIQVARHNLSYIQEIGNGWFGQVLVFFGILSFCIQNTLNLKEFSLLCTIE